MASSLRFPSKCGVILPQRFSRDLSYPVLSLLQRMFIPFLFNDQTHLCLPLFLHRYLTEDSLFFTKPSSHSSSLTQFSCKKTQHHSFQAHKGIKGNRHLAVLFTSKHQDVYERPSYQEKVHTSEFKKNEQAQQFVPVAHQKLRYEQVWREPREVILLLGRCICTSA